MADDINQHIKHKKLSACFSQNRDELVLIFSNTPTNEFVIKADLRPEVSLLSFPHQFSRARKNSVDLFHTLIDIEVREVIPFPLDRSFEIIFSNKDILVFKLYGRRSNILYYKSNEARPQLFRSELAQDYGLTLDDFNKNKELVDPKSVQKLLGSGVCAYLEKQGLGPVSNSALKHLETLPVYFRSHPTPSISLVPAEDHEPNSKTIIELANRYYKDFINLVIFAKEQNKELQAIDAKIKQSKNYILKTNKKLEVLTKRRSYKELADIIMANLHEFGEGETEKELFDFYTNQTIQVKLKPNTLPQKHAENLYRKSKNEKIEVEKLTVNIKNKETLVADLLEQRNKVESIEDWRELKRLTNKKSGNTTDKLLLPYSTYTYEGREIRVGKDAKKNDQLTTKFSSKDDLWLHAKDVPGSHVVIRNPSKQPIPKPIIEYAASLAAHFSKRKHDKLCPVLFTPRKYVRKSKKLAPGQVIVDREEVILVPPFNPNK